MDLTSAHCILVRPPASEGEDDPELLCTGVSSREDLWVLLRKVFAKAATECEIEIAFKHNGDGTQSNTCRTLLQSYIASRTLATGKQIAARLKAKTTHTSGAGLLFLLYGEADGEVRLVLSRFPAGEGIIAEHRDGRLKVDFIKRVFTRNERSYKAAIYTGTPTSTAFWKGKVVDRQMNDPHAQVAEYWIDGFLDSTLKTTSKAGTMRLANALRKVTDTSASAEVKSQIISAAQLVARFHNRTINISQFCQESGLSDESAEAVKGEIPNHLLGDGFRMDVTEFRRLLAFRTVELNNGAVLTADSTRFEDIFEKASLDGDRVRYSTEGAVVDDKLRRRK